MRRMKPSRPRSRRSGTMRSIGRAAGAGEGFDVGRGKNLRVLPERLDVLVDIGANRRDPGLCVDRARLGVRGRDGAAKRVGQRLIDFAGDVVEGALLIEAPHIDRPFDRRAGARRSRAFPTLRA